MSVAAASIIARYAFLIEMDKLSKAAGFDIPKGAGPHVDKAAAKLIKLHGEEALRQFTKLHFANTQKAKNGYKKELGPYGLSSFSLTAQDGLIRIF